MRNYIIYEKHKVEPSWYDSSGLCPDFSNLVHYREKQNKTKIFQSIDYLVQVLGLWEWSLGGHSSKMKA